MAHYVTPPSAEVRYVDYVFLRHGNTDWNEIKEREDSAGNQVNEALIQGATDIPLNEKGLKQAEEAAAKIAASGNKFKKVYTSSLKRASQTADAVAKKIGIQPQTVDGFAACSWGVCEGRTKPYRRDTYNMDYSGNYRGKDWMQMTTRERLKLQAVPGSETTASVIERMEKAMQDISLTCQVGEEVLIVTHQENMKAFKIHCEADTIEEARLRGDSATIDQIETTEFKNCSLHRVRYNLDTRTFTYLGEDKPKQVAAVQSQPKIGVAKAAMGASFAMLALHVVSKWLGSTSKH